MSSTKPQVVLSEKVDEHRIHWEFVQNSDVMSVLDIDLMIWNHISKVKTYQKETVKVKRCVMKIAPLPKWELHIQ